MDFKKQEKQLHKIRSKNENKYCADCGSVGPQWISINFGVLICLRCSGIHRGLNTHMTFVRSLTLDLIKPKVKQQFNALDNSIMNSYYEYKLKPECKLKPNSSSEQAIKFIHDKYVCKKWVQEDAKSPVELYWTERDKQHEEEKRDSFTKRTKGKKEGKNETKKEGMKEIKKEEEGDIKKESEEKIDDFIDFCGTKENKNACEKLIDNLDALYGWGQGINFSISKCTDTKDKIRNKHIFK